VRGYLFVWVSAPVCRSLDGMVAQWASQRQRLGFAPQLGSLSVWSLHVLPVSAWVSSGSLPHSKDVQVRLIGLAKLILSVRGLAGV